MQKYSIKNAFEHCFSLIKNVFLIEVKVFFVWSNFFDWSDAVLRLGHIMGGTFVSL